MDLLYDFARQAPDIDFDNENIHGILSSLNLTIVYWLFKALTTDRAFPVTKPAARLTYDYIIVGAGPGGSVMANRLSENPCRNVLLLEAGEDTPILTEIPAAARLFYRSRIDWEYITEPQDYAAFGLNESRVIWNSGKGLGGGSLLNAMVYVRGNRRNFDDWAADGATGWSYNDVLPYFIKLEDNKNIAELDEGFHQEGGPQTAERINYDPPIKKPIREALKELGYKEGDPNGRQQTGIYDIQALVRNQQRCSSAKSYLVPADSRPNLDIIKGAFVTKIIIEDGRAVGVEYDHNVRGLEARATKEVIVSSGTVRTAQLLMLSGIGPREELERLDINVIANLPVGKNLQDHCASSFIYSTNDTLNIAAKAVLPDSILDYTFNRRGPLTAPNQVTLVAFVNGVNGSAVTEDYPRNELYFAEYNTYDAEYNSNLKDGIFEKYYAPYLLKPVYICFAGLLHPKSRGQITLKSTDPYEYPKIQPNYFQHEEDLEDVADGLRICDAVAESRFLERVQATPVPYAFPGCEEEFESNKTEYYKCHARHLINSFWHPGGVARMGQVNDPRSVVDPQLRVIGVQSLRVVNAAVMPTLTSGNTNTPTLMIAEKAYDMMKDEAKCSETQITVGPVTVEPATAGPVTVEPGTVGPGTVGVKL